MRSLLALSLVASLTTGCIGTKKSGLVTGAITASIGGLMVVGASGGSCSNEGGIPGEFNGAGCAYASLGQLMLGSTILVVGGAILGINALRPSPEPAVAAAPPRALPGVDDVRDRSRPPLPTPAQRPRETLSFR